MTMQHALERYETFCSDILNGMGKRPLGIPRVVFSMALPAHSGPGPLIQFRNHFSQLVELLGRVISQS
jgi:hypothetical protein